MIINSYTEFQPLEEVVVGRAYPGEYWDFLPDPQIRDSLIQVFDETEEDFQNLIKMLEGFGVTVVRPEIMSKEDFQAGAEYKDFTMPPISPRDHAITLGNVLLKNSPVKTFNSIYDHYEKLGATVIDPYDRKFERPHILRNSSASCIFRLGRDIFFDQSDWMKPEQSQWIADNIIKDQGYRIHFMETDGHSDAVFSVPKPGVILSTRHAIHMNYDRDFPGWDVHEIQVPTNELIATRVEKNIKWWTPNYNSLKFREYVDRYLSEWLGEVHETVFDVNTLVVDEQNVIFSQYNKELFDFCNSHGITCHVANLRHRYFWDGGLHCCTLDIRRRGGMETYL